MTDQRTSLLRAPAGGVGPKRPQLLPWVLALLVNIASPALAEIEFTRLGEWPGYARGFARAVKVSGALAYVAAAEGGLFIVDIRNPAQMVTVGRLDTDGEAWDLFVEGSYVYLADGPAGLLVIEVTDPGRPRPVASLALPNSVQGVWLSGQTLYATGASLGLYAIDVSDPGRPRRVGLTPLAGAPQSIAVDGPLACIAAYSAGVHLVDVSDAAHPRVLGNYSEAESQAVGVFLAGSRAYVADSAFGLIILDVTDPSQPRLAGTHPTPDAARAVFVSGTTAYVADQNDGLQVIDLSDPAQPLALAWEDTPGIALGVFVSGNNAYVADYDAGLQAISVADPSAPIRLSQPTVQGNTSAVAVSGNYAYLADLDAGLQIIDISSGAPLRLAGSWKTPGFAFAVAVQNGYACVADAGAGLQVIDVRDPVRPAWLSAYDTPGSALGVFATGSYACVADGEAGLQLIDLSDPVNPRLLGSVDTPGIARGVHQSGRMVYVADSNAGLQLIDISDPGSPRAVGTCATAASALAVFVWGQYAYVAASEAGLQVVDVAQPSAPRIVGSCDTPGVAQGVYVTEGVACLADDEEGLHLIDIRRPAQPTLVATFDSDGETKQALLLGNRVFLADGSRGLVRLGVKGVETPPLLLRQPAGQFVPPGASLAIDVEAVGSQPFAFQWRRDGRNVPGATNAVLRFISFAEADAGEYTVAVSNLYGVTLSEPASYTLLKPPFISFPPRSVTILSGTGPLELEVIATGLAPFAYQWLKDDQALSGATHPLFTIPGPRVEDAGAYTVRVTNPAGSVVSEAAVVRVLEPVGIVRGPASLEAPLGGRVEFTVIATGAEPLRFQWRHNGEAIPGATGPSLILPQVLLPDAGVYTVVVANEAGAVTSAPAELLIALPSFPPGDDFLGRVPLPADEAGTIATTNRLATAEPGEPFHAGKSGHHSIWFGWTAPASGHATLQTVGSDFDTLLGVYTGSAVHALTEIVGDDDGGGFFTSQVDFNAVAGTSYSIAVDGLGDESGRLVLGWRLEPAKPPVPLIIQQPASVSVPRNTGVRLQVQAENAQGYQWFFRGSLLSGATNSQLTLSGVTEAEVGTYQAAVLGQEATLLSDEAVVEIGTEPEVRSRDKLEALVRSNDPDVEAQEREATATHGAFTPLGWRRARVGLSTPGSALPALVVSAGTPRIQVIDNTTSTTQQREENHCGLIGYHSRWLAITPEIDGVLVVDTPGATFPVVLALYGTGRLGDPPLACTAGQPLRSAGVVSGKIYYLAVDGVDGATGPITVLCQVGQPPLPQVNPPPNLQVAESEQLVLKASGPPVPGPAPSYQWLHDGVPVAEATEPELVFSGRTGDAGVYSVVIDNTIGRVTNAIARVAVRVSLAVEGEPDQPRFEAGAFVFALRGNAGQQVNIERSGNLLNWLPGGTLWLSTLGVGEYRDSRTVAYNLQIYRVYEVSVHLVAGGEVLKNGLRYKAWRVTGGRLGQRYVLQQSVNTGADWMPWRTNTVEATDWHFEMPTTSSPPDLIRLVPE